MLFRLIKEGDIMEKLTNVKREIERLEDLLADKKKKIKSVKDCIGHLVKTLEDLEDEQSDLVSKLGYWLGEEKELT